MRHILLLKIFCFLLSSILYGQSFRLIKTINTDKIVNRGFHVWHSNLVVLKNENMYRLFSSNGDQLTDSAYLDIAHCPLCPDFLSAIKNTPQGRRYGFIGKDGKEKTSFEYHWVENQVTGLAILGISGKAFVLDTAGILSVIPGGPYAGIKYLAPNLMEALNTSGYKGVINLNGDTIIPFRYSDIKYSKNSNLFKVAKGRYDQNNISKFQGVIDKNNKEIIPIDYHNIIEYKDKYVVQLEGQGEEVFDFNGKKLPKGTKYLSIENEHPLIYRSLYANGTYYALQNDEKKFVTPISYNKLKPLKYNFFEFSKDSIGSKYCGCLTKTGKELFQIKGYCNIRVLSHDDIIEYKRFDGPWRWYNSSGAAILQKPIKKLEPTPLFSRRDAIITNDTTPFQMLAVSLEGNKFGIYDRNGNEVIPEIYDTLLYLSKRTLYYRLGDKNGLMDSKGKELTAVSFLKVLPLPVYEENGYPILQFYVNGAWGVMNDQGKVVIPPNYLQSGFHLIADKYLWCQKETSVDIYELNEANKLIQD